MHTSPTQRAELKLVRIKELIEQKEKIDTELAHLIGDAEKPLRPSEEAGARS